MKYIITESRLENLIFKYLDSMLDGIKLKEGRYDDSLIFVFPGEEYGLMGWDKPYKLYTYYEVIDDIEHMFSMEEDDVLDIIGRYVESRYNMKVDYAPRIKSMFGSVVDNDRFDRSYLIPDKE